MSLHRVWILLMLLSLTATGVSLLPGQSRPWIGALLLALCYAKGRLVLDVYLGLAHAPVWRRGFARGLGLFILLCLALYLWPELLH